ncbi:protein of unknown function [Modestobacter sp. DSM 44400]|uniref:DnaJ family domain-containing protein n=1 Tax=Modestobacter sp. DSM 44400 TaxID=1550230 RepID=UPI0008951BAD|nr:DUF1992 domain-containing protein [Modestobacter sp. DSM 44400]SDY10617.1 protein of unknown function [Modestobacter sp. DSM 44400]
MTQRKPTGMSFETWIDSQITRAQEDGAFDGLDGAGKPLPRRTREQTSYDWALEWAKRENADVVGMLPSGLVLRREREELPGLVARQPTEELARAVVEAHTARVDQYYRRLADGPWIPVGMPDVEELVAEWRRTRPVVAAEPAASEAPSSRRRRWLRRRAA